MIPMRRLIAMEWVGLALICVLGSAATALLSPSFLT
jgi:hypothetical protein